MICSIHGEEAKQFEKDGQKWWSHKTDDPNYPKGWCNLKPVQARFSQGYTQSSKAKTIAEYQNEEAPDWDKIAIGKVASNIVVALITKGIAIADVKSRLGEIFDLAEAIVRYESNLPF